MQIGDFVRRKSGGRIGCISKVGGPFIEVEWKNKRRENLLHALVTNVPFETTGVPQSQLQIGEELFELPGELKETFKGKVTVNARFYSFVNSAWAYRVQDTAGLTAWIAEKFLCQMP